MADNVNSPDGKTTGGLGLTNVLLGIVILTTAGLCVRSFNPSCVQVCEPTVPPGPQLDTVVHPPGDTVVAPPGDSVRVISLRRRIGA